MTHWATECKELLETERLIYWFGVLRDSQFVMSKYEGTKTVEVIYGDQ